MKISIISFTEQGRSLSLALLGKYRRKEFHITETDLPILEESDGLTFALFTKCKRIGAQDVSQDKAWMDAQPCGISSGTAGGEGYGEDAHGTAAEKSYGEDDHGTAAEKSYGETDHVTVQPVRESVSEWAGRQWKEGSGLLFIGAAGIAVRAIAPHITDKLHDVPVLVMDEKGGFVIPLLSGHVGGANALAAFFSALMGAVPVITTATDLNHTFAVDLFAKKNQLHIVNKEGIAAVSSRALAGQTVTVSVETGHLKAAEYAIQSGKALETGGKFRPKQVAFVPYPPTAPVSVVVSSENRTFDTLLLLRPREYILGIGCKKGKTEEELAEFIEEVMAERCLSPDQIAGIASIDVKKEEPGLLAYARKNRLPFKTYSAGELEGIAGQFAESDFVKEQVGVGNVCERAALAACEGMGTIIVPKQAKNGMTLAVAKRAWSVKMP